MRKACKVAFCTVGFVAASVLTVVRRADGTASSHAGSQGGTYHVATDGKDDPRGGDARRPFATINYALQQAPDGSTIVVGPGTYRGRVSLGKKYDKGLVLRSEVPYRAMLRNRADKVIRCYGCQGVTIEGFDVAHDGPGADPIVVQIDGDGGKGGRDVVIRDN